MNEILRVGQGGYATAESPVWNPHDNKFYFIDIEGMRLCSYDPLTDVTDHYDMGELIGGVVPYYDGSLIVARKDGVFRFKPDTKQFNLVSRLEPDKPWNRPNDISLVKCSDDKTRIFIGTMPLNAGDRPKSGSLYVLDPETGEINMLRNNLTTSNGLSGYTKNGITHLFFSDSHLSEQKIFSAVYDPKTNTLANEEVFLDMTEMDGRPDGATLAYIDSDLCYVIAAIDSGKILFHDVNTKEVRHEITLPEGVKNVTKCAISPEGLCLITTLNRKWKEGADPQRLHGEVYTLQLPDNIKPGSARLSAAKLANDGVVESYVAGANRLKTFMQMVHTRQRLMLPAQNQGLPPQAPDNDFTGNYPEEFRGALKGQKIATIGYGQVFDRMIGQAARFLGMEIEFYDKESAKQPLPGTGDTRVDDISQFSPDATVYICTPPATHLEYIEKLAAEGRAFYSEKPIVIGSEQLASATNLLSQVENPAYCGDFHYFMAMPLLSLLGGKMPYRDTLTISGDVTGELQKAIDSRQPLFQLSDIKSVRAKYLQGGQSAAATMAGRDLGKGKAGGMVYDLIVHLTNILNTVGMEVGEVETAELARETETSGVYKRMPKAVLKENKESEMYAHVTGKIGKHGADFDFEVGKYAANNEQFIELELHDGRKLKFEYEPPNRKTSVTLFDAQGQSLGRVDSKADPYLMMIAHAQEHLRSGRKGVMFGSEGLKSIQQLERMHECARAPSDTLDLASTSPVIDIRDRTRQAA